MRPLETHTGPAWPPLMTVIPAPDTAKISTQTPHNAEFGDLATARARAERNTC